MPAVPISASIQWTWSTRGQAYVFPQGDQPVSVPAQYPTYIPPRVGKVTRDILRMQRQMRRYQHQMGEYVRWYEFDAISSTSDPIYDEGPSRVYRPARQVPALFVQYQQPMDVPQQEGRYTIASLHATFSTDQLMKSGLTNPLQADAHYYDRIEFNGFIYKVERYELQGYVHGTWMTVAIDGHQVHDEELQLDVPLDSPVVIPLQVLFGGTARSTGDPLSGGSAPLP